MGGTTDIDSTVTIDMWETDDANGQIAKGHKIINSNHGRTYIVPGAHYYGVNNGGIYNGWEPWMVSGDMTKNPTKDDPHLLGGKLHVWNDQGPTGYTMTEIANLALPSLQAFAEKLWGTKGSKDYAEFQTRAAMTQPVPGVTVFDRLPATRDGGLLLNLAGENVLSATNSVVSLTHDGQTRRDLEYPWTLTFEVCKTAETGTRGVILSSGLAEICADFSRSEEQKSKDAAGKEIKTKVTKRGLGVVRAAGSPGADPASSHLANDVSRVYSEPLPLNHWATVTIVGERRHTTVFLNGDKTGESTEQALCPLGQLGSSTGNSFVGKLRNLKVYNRALTPKEIGRAAGLELPDNLAAGCAVKATASDTANGFVPAYITDGNPATRWSSGPVNDPKQVEIDLGKLQTFNTVTINWETAYPNAFAVAASKDGEHWAEVAKGGGKVGLTSTRFAPVTARYVRLGMSQPATPWGYSIWELEVLNAKTPAPGH
jgi:hexosaminidase